MDRITGNAYALIRFTNWDITTLYCDRVEPPSRRDPYYRFFRDGLEVGHYPREMVMGIECHRTDETLPPKTVPAGLYRGLSAGTRGTLYFLNLLVMHATCWNCGNMVEGVVGSYDEATDNLEDRGWLQTEDGWLCRKCANERT